VAALSSGYQTLRQFVALMTICLILNISNLSTVQLSLNKSEHFTVVVVEHEIDEENGKDGGGGCPGRIDGALQGESRIYLVLTSEFIVLIIRPLLQAHLFSPLSGSRNGRASSRGANGRRLRQGGGDQDPGA